MGQMKGMEEIRIKCRLNKVGQKEGIEIEALADTGAVMTLLPEDFVDNLGFERNGKAIVA